jgi:hypothetical protein
VIVASTLILTFNLHAVPLKYSMCNQIPSVREAFPSSAGHAVEKKRPNWARMNRHRQYVSPVLANGGEKEGPVPLSK